MQKDEDLCSFSAKADIKSIVQASQKASNSACKINDIMSNWRHLCSIFLLPRPKSKIMIHVEFILSTPQDLLSSI